jgi:hypothetical protein
MDERYGRFSRLLINQTHPRALRSDEQAGKFNAADGDARRPH